MGKIKGEVFNMPDAVLIRADVGIGPYGVLRDASRSAPAGCFITLAFGPYRRGRRQRKRLTTSTAMKPRTMPKQVRPRSAALEEASSAFLVTMP